MRLMAPAGSDLPGEIAMELLGNLPNPSTSRVSPDEAT
jgi:hypothetical protein